MSTDVQVIQPAHGWAGMGWAELWRFRELLYWLAWRDVRLRYKQTFLGAAWVVLQPLAMLLVFQVFFGHWAGLESKTGDIPYGLYVFTGLLPWNFFAGTVTIGGQSLLASAHLITKVYFPRLVVPLAAVGSGLVDLAIGLGLLVTLMLFYGVRPSASLACVPIVLVGVVVCAAGTATLFSAISVTYRDFRYVVPFMLQLWFFVTPIVFPSTLVPPRWRPLLALNPLFGLTDSFRNAVLGRAIDLSALGFSLCAAAAVFFAGVYRFRRMEHRFADVI